MNDLWKAAKDESRQCYLYYYRVAKPGHRVLYKIGISWNNDSRYSTRDKAFMTLIDRLPMPNKKRAQTYETHIKRANVRWKRNPNLGQILESGGDTELFTMDILNLDQVYASRKAENDRKVLQARLAAKAPIKIAPVKKVDHSKLLNDQVRAKQRAVIEQRKHITHVAQKLEAFRSKVFESNREELEFYRDENGPFDDATTQIIAERLKELSPAEEESTPYVLAFIIVMSFTALWIFILSSVSNTY